MSVLELRPMQLDDLSLVERWLSEPHVARWYLAGSSLDAELEDIRAGVTGGPGEPGEPGGHGVHLLVVLHDGAPIGWCQWYPCSEDPEWAAEIGAGPGDAGIDYAIGEPDLVGVGVGTALVALLVAQVHAAQPGCSIMSDPEAANTASRRVLEKNGFELVGVKAMDSEPSDDPMAIYRYQASSPSPS